jgi:curli production assembly/transport component CsgE
MLFPHFLSVLALQLCVVSMASAQGGITTSSVDPHRTLNRTEVGGIVTGQTITLAGREFYDSFSAAWREKDEIGHFTVAISERPSARWGSQVFVDYGNQRLFQTFLPPNRSLITPIGNAAAAQVYQAILDYQLAQFFGDPDLARDEL